MLFANTAAANDFLASRIVDEAERQSAPLSDIERQMLYYSETDPGRPGIAEANEEFDDKYDPNAYEPKVAQLIQSARKRAREQGELVDWTKAVAKLREGDFYLLVMIDMAGTERARWDRLKLWVTGLLICAGLLAAIYALQR